MKKIFGTLFGKFNLGAILLGLIIILITVNGALATEISSNIYYPNSYYSNNNNGYTSSAQYYSVLFDGEGEANVIAKYVIFNNAREDVKEVRLEIPGQDVRILNVFSLDSSSGSLQYNGYNSNNRQGYTDGYDNNGYGYNNYGKVQFVDYKSDRLSNSVVLNVKMNNSIKPLQFTTFLVSYKSGSYSVKNNGLLGNIFDYKFETAKLDRDIGYTHVGVSVDSNLFMDDVSGSVNYRNNMFDTFSSSAKISSASYSRMQGYVNSIGTGQKIKTANNLDPYESLSVSGKYSDSKVALDVWKYIWMIIFGLIGLFLLLFCFFRARRLVLNSRDEVRKVIASGFLYALLLFVLWGLFFFFVNFMERYYNLWIFIMVIFILLIIVSIILLLGPCIYFAVKYKPVFVVWYLAGFFVSLLVFALVIVIGYLVLFYKPSYPYGYY